MQEQLDFLVYLRKIHSSSFFTIQHMFVNSVFIYLFFFKKSCDKILYVIMLLFLQHQIVLLSSTMDPNFRFLTYLYNFLHLLLDKRNMISTFPVVNRYCIVVLNEFVGHLQDRLFQNERREYFITGFYCIFCKSCLQIKQWIFHWNFLTEYYDSA